MNERATYLCSDLFELLAFRLLYILICFQGTITRLFNYQDVILRHMPSCAFSFLLQKKVRLRNALLRTGGERNRHVPKFLARSDAALFGAACVAACRGSGPKRKLSKRNSRKHVCRVGL